MKTALSFSCNGTTSKISYIENKQLIIREYEDFDEAIKEYDLLLMKQRRNQ